MKIVSYTRIVIMLVALSMLTSACGRRPEAEKCEDPKATADAVKNAAAKGESGTPAPAAPKPERIIQDAKDIMWCRSCAVGPAGYMSCQTVRQATTTETTEALRERARLAACKDAAFPEGKCPAASVISLVCKGDPPPKDETAAGKAMLEALKGSGPIVLTKDGKTVPNIMYDKKSGPGAPPANSDNKKAEGADAPAAPSSAAPHIE
jgi:hypothetical protein